MGCDVFVTNFICCVRSEVFACVLFIELLIMMKEMRDNFPWIIVSAMCPSKLSQCT